MTFLYFPGASDPNFSLKSKQAKDLVINQAKKRGFTKIQIASYVGHTSYEATGFLSYENVLSCIKNNITQCEAKMEPYTIYTKSFSCSAVAEILYRDPNLKHLEKVIMWGCAPYHLYPEIRKFRLAEFLEGGISNGVRLNENTWNNIFPVELFVKSDSKYNVKIGVGGHDRLIDSSFFEYLRLLGHQNTNFSFELIDGLGHTPINPNNEFLDFIFQN